MNVRIYISVIFLVFAFITASCDLTEDDPVYNYTIESIWWSDTLDTNMDGYVQFKRLNFNVHLEQDASRTINARVYYKLTDASDYSFYAYSGDKVVNGSNADNNFFVPIGKPNKDLEKGLYNFNLEIYESNDDELKAAPSAEDSTVLSDNKFEAGDEDNVYIVSTSWLDEYDRNENGYWRYATLIIDVDNSGTLDKQVYAEVYISNAGEDNYTLYYSTESFTINGFTSDDAISLTVGSGQEELSYGSYDFIVDIKEYNNDGFVAFVDKEEGSLGSVNFESEDEDAFYYSIHSIEWSDKVDVDSDEFTQSRILSFDVDVDKEYTRRVYAKIYAQHPDSSDYNLYDSTETFEIYSSLSDDMFSVPIGSKTQLDSSVYGFLISIYEETADTTERVEISISGVSDILLFEQKFESINQDTTNAP